MKRYFLFLLLALLPMLANAYDAEIDGIYYDFSGNNATVTYRNSNYNSYSGTVVIPEFVTYNGNTYSVTSIGYAAFRDCSSLTSVTIGDNVTSIGNYAFEDCSGLTSVTIGDSVTSILYDAFSGCSSLQKVIVPDIAAWCAISFSNTWANPLDYAEHLFSDEETEITNLVIPEGVTSIRRYAFYGCSGLTSITIPNSVTSIGDYAFCDCSGLTSVTIGDSVTSIGDYAFCGCSGLTSVTIGDSVTSIGDYAFYGCSSLTSITIPNNVTSIDYRAFDNCSGLVSVTLKSNAIVSLDRSSSSLLTSIFGSQVKEYVIGEGVTGIGDNAFAYCSGLTSISVGNSVTNIGSYAFYNCNSLISVTIGAGVLSVENNAFQGSSPKKVIWLPNTPPTGYKNLQGAINYVANNQYTGLSNITVYPYLSSLFEVEGVKYVPVNPAERTCDAIGCTYNESAENICISETVTYKGVSLSIKNIKPYLCYGNKSAKRVNINPKCDIDSQAFYGCTSLTEAMVSNQGDIGSQAFYGCSALFAVELGENVKSIGSESFMNCSKLNNIVIPDSVASLGDNIFKNCTALKSAKIGNGVKSIPTYAFSGCSSLTDMQLGNGVAAINGYAFSGCSLLPTIQIPQNVTVIGNYVFNGCTGMKTVLFDDGEAKLSLGSNGSNPLFVDCPLDSVYIGRDISYPTAGNSGYSPFYRNTSLRSVAITDKETEISMNEFYGCSNLRNVRIGDGVTSFGDWSFSGCRSLDYFSFGSSVQSIGKEAFSDCVVLTNLISKATTPPLCGSQALEDINKWECTLSVPRGYIAAYQQADQWKDFFFMEEKSFEDAIVDVKADDVEEMGYYDLQGRKQSAPQKGFNIIRYSDGTSKKVFVK